MKHFNLETGRITKTLIGRRWRQKTILSQMNPIHTLTLYSF